MSEVAESPGVMVVHSSALFSPRTMQPIGTPTPGDIIRFAQDGGYVRVIDGRTGRTRAWLVPPGDAPRSVANAGPDDLTPIVRRHQVAAVNRRWARKRAADLTSITPPPTLDEAEAAQFAAAQADGTYRD